MDSTVSSALGEKLVERGGTKLWSVRLPRDTGPVEWTRANLDTVRRALLRYGAVRLEGTPVRDPQTLSAVAEVLGGELLQYNERSTPRSQVKGSVYTSTEYPADQTIPQHNESCYSANWPDQVYFLSSVTAASGGQTPVADSRAVLAALPPDLVRRFAERGVLYTRAYHAGIGLSWQEAYQTEDPKKVEDYCAANDIAFEWDGDLLRTRQRRPALGRHPVTGEQVWFNQAHLFHVSALQPATREALLGLFDEKDLPRNAYYGDGEAITDDEMDTIRAAYDQELLSADWSDGDIMVVDNVLMSHGRMPYEGKRTVLVAMTSTDWSTWPH